MPIVTAVAQLILINGLPGSGKSTVARSVATERPLSLVLDVDVVRGLLSGWIDTPTTAGLLARELALAMCATHLGAGYDVLVPQFLGRPEFVVALEEAAREAGVPFVEIALLLPPERAAERVAKRSAASARREHADAGALLEPEGGASALAEMEHRLITVLDDRPATLRVDADREPEAVRQEVRGCIDRADRG
jgi:predicted kinase